MLLVLFKHQPADTRPSYMREIGGIIVTDSRPCNERIDAGQVPETPVEHLLEHINPLCLSDAASVLN